MRPRVSCVKVPLEGYRAQIWVETLKRWHDMSGSPTFPSPEEALNWATKEVATHPLGVDRQLPEFA